MSLLFRWLGPVLPGPVSRMMYFFWFRTYRYPMPIREQHWLKSARQSHIEFDQHDICLYQWGRGKTILLAHGWNGRATQLGGFVEPLLAQGFAVLGFDAPGHGQSSGRSTSAVQIARLIARLDREYGPFEAVIAHSLGVPAALYAATHENLRLHALVGIGSPGSLPYLINKYADTMRIPAAVTGQFLVRLQREFGDDWEQRLDITHMAGQLDASTRALIIHDNDDLDIPASIGQHIAGSIPGAGFVLTSGLGHRRILRSAAVTGLVVQFIVACARQDDVIE